MMIINLQHICVQQLPTLCEKESQYNLTTWHNLTSWHDTSPHMIFAGEQMVHLFWQPQLIFGLPSPNPKIHLPLNAAQKSDSRTLFSEFTINNVWWDGKRFLLYAYWHQFFTFHNNYLPFQWYLKSIFTSRIWRYSCAVCWRIQIQDMRIHIRRMKVFSVLALSKQRSKMVEASKFEVASARMVFVIFIGLKALWKNSVILSFKSTPCHLLLSYARTWYCHITCHQMIRRVKP